MGGAGSGARGKKGKVQAREPSTSLGGSGASAGVGAVATAGMWTTGRQRATGRGPCFSQPPATRRAPPHLEHQPLLPAVGQRELDLAVQPAGAQQRRVQRVGTVGGHDDLAGVGVGVGGRERIQERFSTFSRALQFAPRPPQFQRCSVRSAGQGAAVRAGTRPRQRVAVGGATREAGCTCGRPQPAAASRGIGSAGRQMPCHPAQSCALGSSRGRAGEPRAAHTP